MTRCFLGFDLCAASREYLRERLEPLHRLLSDSPGPGNRGWPVRLVPPDNWHATLLFFADLDDPARAAVWQEVEAGVRAGTWRSLPFSWRKLALWPSPRHPSLLCVEAERYAGSAAWPLTQRLDEAPFSQGEGAHLRDYVPHITVMRLRHGRGARLPRPQDWDAVQPLLPAIDAEAIRFDRVSFFLSTVSPQQPLYPRERSLALWT